MTKSRYVYCTQVFWATRKPGFDSWYMTVPQR